VTVRLIAVALILTQAQWERFHRIVCSRTDVAHIRNDDPALRFFRHPGYPLKDAKIDLAIERANGCENVIEKRNRRNA
jgi:hypothetical protein